MTNLLLAAGQLNKVSFIIPLIVVVSLVYAATRHEDLGLIARHAVRIGGWITGFMLVILLLLIWVSTQT